MNKPPDSHSNPAPIHSWLIEPLPSDVAQSINRLAVAEDVQHLAVMPDVHLAHDICVGTVMATSNLIYPSAVGGDIGCGMAAMRLDADAAVLADETQAARLLNGLYEHVPANRHRARDLPNGLPPRIAEFALSHASLEKFKHRDGRVQLGTLGRGNHFLEFQVDEVDCLWAMVHSGSRAMGQAITAHHLSQVKSSPGHFSTLTADSPEGQAYLHDVAWAIEYAKQNRLAMLSVVGDLVRKLFGISPCGDSIIHSDHNHVRRETHFGREYWVHRKGAQSARVDEPGVIPGSMGTASFHVAGRGCAESLCSSSHGAGRRLSRSDACRRISRREFDRQMTSVWFDRRRAQALRDEAPGAYKDIRAVMRAQRNLTRIVRALRPILSYKGV